MERKKRALPLTPAQAARPERRYQPSSYERGLSKQVSRACDRFFRRRGLNTGGDPNVNTLSAKADSFLEHRIH